jgi:outer membrane protein
MNKENNDIIEWITKWIGLSTALITAMAINAPGQDTVVLNLENVLALAVEQAIDLKIASSQALEQEYAFQRADLRFKPQLFMDATLPNLNHSIESRPLPDGTDAFVSRSTMYNGIGIDLNYQLEKTGGFLSVRSDIERLDIFKTGQFDKSTTYFIRPLQISYTHPLFAFNELKWQKERLSLLYLEFKENFARVREEILIKGIDLFNQAYTAQQKVELNRQKIAETDSLIFIKNRLHAIGKVTKTELLRLNLDQKNNDLNLQQEAMYWRQAQIALADFMGMGREKTIILDTPQLLQDVNIDWSRAMTLAIQNNYVQYNYQRRLRESEAQKERAARDKDIRLDVTVSLGLNNTSDNLSGILNPLLDREIFSASIRAPLTGYKRYELAEKIASEAALQEALRIEKEQQDLSREAYSLVTNFELLKNTLAARDDARKTADEILDLTRQQFLQGNATHTEITLAAQDREQALLQYYQTLMDIIKQYYEIRKLCMYDFIHEKGLSEGSN